MNRVQPLFGVPVAVLGRAAEAVPGSGLRFVCQKQPQVILEVSQFDNMPSHSNSGAKQPSRAVEVGEGKGPSERPRDAGYLVCNTADTR